MPRDLQLFFNPNSIAIIGASANEGKVGHIIFQNLISRFKGQLYPVNNQESEILGFQTYPKISQLPQVPDLVLVAIPAQSSLDILDEALELGIKNLVFYAAGFKEVGLEKIELNLLEKLQKQNVNLLGPNCFGFINQKLNLNATFGKSPVYKGKLKIISQSGAITSSLIDFANQRNFGFDEFITIGNKSQIDESDILEYFGKNTSEDFAVGMYLESITNGEKFQKAIDRLKQRHPIFVLKPGKNLSSKEAIKSHTGSIAGDDAIFSQAMREMDIQRCDTLEEFFILSNYYSWNPTPKKLNNQVLIITNAGGPGVIATDYTESINLKLEELTTEITDSLKNSLPNLSIRNPLDLIGDAKASRYQTAAEEVLNSNSDHLVFILTPQTTTEVIDTAKVIVEVSTKTNKTIYPVFIGGEEIEAARKQFRENQLLFYDFPEIALKTIKLLTSNTNTDSRIPTPIQSLIRSTEVTKILESGVSQNLKTLGNQDSQIIAKKLGLKTPKSIYLSRINDFQNNLSYPLVLKISGDQILHKKEIGGVIQDIHSLEKFQKSFIKLEELSKELKLKGYQDVKIQVQEQVPGGVEVIVGIKKDPVFGPILLFGLGGSYAEIIDDRNLIRLPSNTNKISQMISSSKANLIFKKQNVDIQSLIQELQKFSEITEYLDLIKEIEINPLIINETGIWSVDSKVILEKNHLLSLNKKDYTKL